MNESRLTPGRREHLFAIVRVDDFHSPTVPVQERISITKVMEDADAANREVVRLNSLKAGKQVHYFMQITRLVPKSVPAPQMPDLVMHVVKAEQGAGYDVVIQAKNQVLMIDANLILQHGTSVNTRVPILRESELPPAILARMKTSLSINPS